MGPKEPRQVDKLLLSLAFSFATTVQTTPVFTNICLDICGQPLSYYDRRDCICYHAAQGAKASRQTVATGNTKGGSITVPLTSCLTGLELAA